MLKVVPDTETKFQLAGDNSDVVWDDSIEWIMSPYDEYALEEAILTKESLGGTVTVLTIGSGKESQVIRKALAMGADDAIVIQNEALAGADASNIAKVLAKEVEELQPDLVFAGKLATDSNDSFVGPAIAAILDWPSISEISALKVTEDSISATRDAPGRKEKFTAKLPAIVTVDKGINEPRYPKLPDIMKAKRKPLNEKDGSEFTTETKTTQISVEFPPQKSGGEIFDGDLDDSVQKLVAALHEKEKVF